MPRMSFSTIYTRIESLTNVTSQRALIKDAIQWGLDELTDRDLPYLMTESFFTTVAPYETGTVTATNGSKTITGSGTTFTTAMVGRKIRVDSQQAYYRISAYVSATEVTLEAPYQGTTTSGATYSIYKDEYKLAADVDTYKVLRQIEDSISLGSIEASAFDIYNPTPFSEGLPRYEVLTGTKLDTYTTGTVSITVNLSALTGSGTSWLSVEGLSRGSRIVIGEYVYTVKSVDSDTAITIYEKASATASTSAYTVHLDNLIIMLKDIPDEAFNVYYRYQRMPFPLINDTDIPDLPEKYHYLLVLYGEATAWTTKDKEEAAKKFVLFNGKKRGMWARLSHVSDMRTYRRKSMDINDSWNVRGPRPPGDYGVPLEL